MLGRTLSLAAVTLFIGSFAAPAAWAQAQNLEAGKSPSQLFAGTCNACHKSPRGLLKTVSAGSLPGFLRQHYTTSGDMAAQLSSFLIANGASDTRSRPGGEAKPAPATDQVDRQGRRLRVGTPAEGARPDSEEAPLQGRRRLARPGEAPETARPAAQGQEGPGQAISDRGPDGRKLSAKQSLSKRGKPGGEEAPSARDEPQKLEPAMDDKAKAETAREGDAKPETFKPAEEGKSEAVRIEPSREGGSETPSLRAEPAPGVTTAPPATSAPPGASAVPPAAASNGLAQPSAPRQGMPPAPPEPSAAVTASVPPPAPAPAGPPAPPISQ
jgi:hypothetical protein